MNNCDRGRASALRGECARIEELEQRMRRCTEQAEALIKEIDASKKWPGPVVTQVVPASDFWSAEEYHQNYLQKNPGGYTCHYIRTKWKL